MIRGFKNPWRVDPTSRIGEQLRLGKYFLSHRILQGLINTKIANMVILKKASIKDLLPGPLSENVQFRTTEMMAYGYSFLESTGKMGQII